MVARHARPEKEEKVFTKREIKALENSTSHAHLRRKGCSLGRKGGADRINGKGNRGGCSSKEENGDGKEGETRKAKSPRNGGVKGKGTPWEQKNWP